MPTPSRVCCFQRSLRVLAVAVAFLLSAQAAHAVPISGQLSIVGSLSLSGTTLDFALPVGGGFGAFTVVPPETGSFVALPPGSTGSILDLNAAPAQVGTPISVANLLTFLAVPTTHFDLQFIHPGVFASAQCFAAPAAGQTCTPPSNPAFQFVNVPNGFGLGSVLSFSLSGVALDGADVSNFTGTVTAQFSQPYQNVLATLAGGGVASSSYSAVFQVVPVPEPSSLALGGLGLALLGLARRSG